MSELTNSMTEMASLMPGAMRNFNRKRLSVNLVFNLPRKYNCIQQLVGYEYFNEQQYFYYVLVVLLWLSVISCAFLTWYLVSWVAIVTDILLFSLLISRVYIVRSHYWNSCLGCCCCCCGCHTISRKQLILDKIAPYSAFGFMYEFELYRAFNQRTKQQAMDDWELTPHEYQYYATRTDNQEVRKAPDWVFDPPRKHPVIEHSLDFGSDDDDYEHEAKQTQSV